MRVNVKTTTYVSGDLSERAALREAIIIYR